MQSPMVPLNAPLNFPLNAPLNFPLNAPLNFPLNAPLNVPLGDGRGAGTVMVSMQEHPPDYTVWSIASINYGNPCCLGLIALIFSMKSRDRKMVGDMIGAKEYGSKARCLNGFALGLIIICFIIIVVSSVVFEDGKRK